MERLQLNGNSVLVIHKTIFPEVEWRQWETQQNNISIKIVDNDLNINNSEYTDIIYEYIIYDINHLYSFMNSILKSKDLFQKCTILFKFNEPVISPAQLNISGVVISPAQLNELCHISGWSLEELKHNIYIAKSIPDLYLLDSSFANQLLWDSNDNATLSTGIHQICSQSDPSQKSKFQHFHYNQWNFHYKNYMAMKVLPKSLYCYEMIMKNIIWNHYSDLKSNFLEELISHQCDQYIDHFFRSHPDKIDELLPMVNKKF